MLELSLRMGSEANPLVVHNSRLSIATDEFTQRLARLTAKTKKTLEDHHAISRTEWEGGLYWDEDLGPYVPTSWPMSSLWQAAKLTKNGEGLRRAATVLGPNAGARIPIEYDGPRGIEKMWEDESFRLVQSLPQGRVRVTRTRPRFVPWTLTATVMLDESLMDVSVLREIAMRAGRNIGIGERVDGLRARYETEISEAVAA